MHYIIIESKSKSQNFYKFFTSKNRVDEKKALLVVHTSSFKPLINLIQFDTSRNTRYNNVNKQLIILQYNE